MVGTQYHNLFKGKNMQINRLNWDERKVVEEYSHIVEFNRVSSASKEDDGRIRLLLIDGDGREWEESGCQNGYTIEIISMDEMKEAIIDTKAENEKLLEKKGLNNYEIMCYYDNSLLVFMANNDMVHKVKTSYTNDGFSTDSVDYKVFRDGKYITVDEIEYNQLEITEFKETVSNYRY